MVSEYVVAEGGHTATAAQWEEFIRVFGPVDRCVVRVGTPLAFP